MNTKTSAVTDAGNAPRGRWDLLLNDSGEAILVRDALIEYKHILKNSTSERGQRLCRIVKALAEDLDDKIRRYGA